MSYFYNSADTYMHALYNFCFVHFSVKIRPHQYVLRSRNIIDLLFIISNTYCMPYDVRQLMTSQRSASLYS